MHEKKNIISSIKVSVFSHEVQAVSNSGSKAVEPSEEMEVQDVCNALSMTKLHQEEQDKPQQDHQVTNGNNESRSPSPETSTSTTPDEEVGFTADDGQEGQGILGNSENQDNNGNDNNNINNNKTQTCRFCRRKRAMREGQSHLTS